MNNFLFPFILTSFAAFSTMLGTLLIFFKFKNYNKLIVASLSFAAGVMITVSITDLIPESLLLLKENNNDFTSLILCIISIILGIIISMILNYYLPDNSNNTLYKVGIISMLAIILHNIPEGIITFITASSNMTLGISLAIAIALHNIPEGIAISIPIYYATKSKLLAFKYTLISALSEPFGAVITYLFLQDFITNNIMGYLFSIIAGIMIQIAFCELLKTAKGYNVNKTVKLFFLIGLLFSVCYVTLF